MAHQFKLGQRRHARQHGIAMIMVISLAALMSSYFIASGLSRTQSEVSIEQDRRSLQAMKEAKAALITYAASQAWGTDGVNDQPGGLPCPATDNAGQAGTCSATASTRVGRFPWKTIGASELRDGNGEILWYALSAGFRKASGTTVINSDTQGSLTITGNTPASNVVAVIIAPGKALSGQDRASSAVANYLESTNATNTDTFVTKVAPDTWNNTTEREVVFNDSIVVITQADLMAIVEPAVAARIGDSTSGIKPYLETYRSEWGAFPYPATFAGPDPGTSGASTTRTQSNYLGSTSQTGGLLPLTASASYSWTAGSGAVTLTGGVAGSISGVSCATFSTTYWRCSFTLNSLNSVATCGSAVNRHCMVNPIFRVAGNMGTNAGRSFAELPLASDVTVTNSSGSTNRTMSSKTVGGTLISTARGTVNFDGTHSYANYQSSSFTRAMRVTIPIVTVSSLTGASDAYLGWFIKNEWYRQVYYAVSPGFLPGGGASCVAGSTCLTVNNLPSSYATANDKRSVLIFAGRALTGSRPSSSLADYLEGENQTPADRIFTHQTGSAASLNDRAIVISP